MDSKELIDQIEDNLKLLIYKQQDNGDTTLLKRAKSILQEYRISEIEGKSIAQMPVHSYNYDHEERKIVPLHEYLSDLAEFQDGDIFLTSMDGLDRKISYITTKENKVVLLKSDASLDLCKVLSITDASAPQAQKAMEITKLREAHYPMCGIIPISLEAAKRIYDEEYMIVLLFPDATFKKLSKTDDRADFNDFEAAIQHVENGDHLGIDYESICSMWDRLVYYSYWDLSEEEKEEIGCPPCYDNRTDTWIRPFLGFTTSDSYWDIKHFFEEEFGAIIRNDDISVFDLW